MGKIKVLVTVGSMGIGGNEIFTINLAKNIDREKFDLDVLIYSDAGINRDYLKQIKNSGSKFFLGHNNSPHKLCEIIHDIKVTRKILNQGRYDIIHCNSCSFLGIFRGVIAAKNLGNVKIVAHSHNAGKDKNNLVDKFIRRLLKKYLCHSIDRGFTCSDVAGKSKYTEKFIRSERYMVVNNAIDIEKYKYNLELRKRLRDELKIPQDVFVIGNIGRLDYQKNQQYLIKILKVLVDRGNKVKLLIIGAGTFESDLKQLTDDLSLKEDVLWLGSRNDANRYYHVMDCFAMTSKYEGFPFVLTEAQVNGLYCIVSDCISKNVNVSGMVEFVSLEELPEKWAKRMENIPQSRMPQEAVQRVIDKYDVTKEIKKIEETYRMMLEA